MTKKPSKKPSQGPTPCHITVAGSRMPLLPTSEAAQAAPQREVAFFSLSQLSHASSCLKELVGMGWQRHIVGLLYFPHFKQVAQPPRAEALALHMHNFSIKVFSFLARWQGQHMVHNSSKMERLVVWGTMERTESAFPWVFFHFSRSPPYGRSLEFGFWFQVEVKPGGSRLF